VTVTNLLDESIALVLSGCLSDMNAVK